MGTSLLFLLAFSFSFFSGLSFSPFSPVDNHLINCGSALDAAVDGRRFVSDFHSSNPGTPLQSSALTTALCNFPPRSSSPQIYHTARVFRKPSRYAVEIKEPGTHMVRLHFDPFVSSNFDLREARFHVLVDNYVALSNFTVSDTLVKEYLVWVSQNKLVITIVPTQKGKLGFVNAIEVLSAPKDLIPDTATLVRDGETQKFEGLMKQGLETVHRVNVGGPKVTPFNDSVWRTWIPDDGFFKSSDLSSKVHFSGRINYQVGGASREVCPDFVYNSARVIASKSSSIPEANMTWVFQVTGGHRYLVRLHFCDIASLSLGSLYFNVYINEQLASKDVDLSSIAYELASPYYADFVVDSDNLGAVSVVIGRSNLSMAYAVDGILNGVEIMKMNNSMASFDGKMCRGMALKNWPRGNSGGLITLVVVLCLLLLSVSMLMRRKIVRVKDSFSWTKLPTEVSEVNLKVGIQSSLGGKF